MFCCAESKKRGRGPGVNKMFNDLQKENQPPKENPQGCIVWHITCALLYSSFCVNLFPTGQTYPVSKRRGRGLGVKTLAKQRLAQESQITPKEGTSGIAGRNTKTQDKKPLITVVYFAISTFFIPSWCLRDLDNVSKPVCYMYYTFARFGDSKQHHHLPEHTRVLSTLLQWSIQLTYKSEHRGKCTVLRYSFCKATTD